MKVLSKKLLGRFVAVMFIAVILNGCLAPRTGEYFLSTREAGKRWGRAGSYWGEPMDCVSAGFLTLPTVVGPIFYWIIRPVYDTVDWVVISPAVDVACLPMDFYLRTWRRVKLHWVDDKGLPCVGVRLRLPSGSVQTSDEDGNMVFFTWVKCDEAPELISGEYYKKPYIPLTKFQESYGDRYVPVTKVQEIRLRRKQKLSPCIDADIMMFVPDYGKPIPFDLFAKDWVVPYGVGLETNILIETTFNYPHTEIKVSLPDDKAGGFCAFGRIRGIEDCGLHEWMEWGQNTNIVRSIRRIEYLGEPEQAFCIRQIEDKLLGCQSESNSVYGVIRRIGVPFELWSAGVPMLFFNYRLNARGANWFEWAEDYDIEIPRLFRAGCADVCGERMFHLKDTKGRDVWIECGEGSRVKRYSTDPRKPTPNKSGSTSKLPVKMKKNK